MPVFVKYLCVNRIGMLYSNCGVRTHHLRPKPMITLERATFYTDCAKVKKRLGFGRQSECGGYVSLINAYTT